MRHHRGHPSASRWILQIVCPTACAASLAASLPLLLAAGAAAQVVDPARGSDPRVDYASLDRLGPWDDRNYRLTAEDLALLAPDEHRLSDPIPAFFRVELRRAQPHLRRSGPAQYPRSALQIFRRLHTGYQIGGKLYRGVVRENGRFRVLLDARSERKGSAAKFLSGEARVTSPEGAAESAIKINPVDPDRVIAGSNGPGNGQSMHYSTDGGSSWQAAEPLPLGGTCCDPTVDWSSDGSLAHAATLGDCRASGCAVWYYRSNDGGQTWNDLQRTTPGDPRRELTATGSDKELLHVDQHPTSPHRDNVYLTWHDNNVMQVARSTDDGNSWSTLSFTSDPLGIGSDITTDAAGRVYYFWPAFDSRQIVLKTSTDGGVSFAPGVTVVDATEASFAFPVPSQDTREVFVYVSADSDRSGGPYSGSVYVAWTDSTAPTGGTPSANHARVRVAASRDGGASWTVTTPHETADQGAVDRYHPWLAVGPDGRVHVAFYDTRRSNDRTAVDLYYAASVDGGQSFSTPLRLTAEQSPKINDSFEFGDYNGLDAVMTDVIAVYTDNRREGGGGGDSVDVYAAGLSGGDRPQVVITAPSDGAVAPLGSALTFRGSASDPQDGDLTAALSWFSSRDGAIGSGGAFDATLSLGVHTVTASATDASGLTGVASIAVTVDDAGGNTVPVVTITAPRDGEAFPAGASIALSGTASDAEDGDLSAALSWSSDRDGGLGSGADLQATLAEGSHTISARATDGAGAAGTASVTIEVGCSGFSEDFESGTGGWAAEGLWHVADGSPCAQPAYASATHSLYFGLAGACDYDTGARVRGDLVSPPIAGLTGDSVLRFAYLRSVEQTVNLEAEGTRVEVSIDGSTDWTPVWSRSSLDPSEGVWTASPEIPLDAFAGETIRLRFRFDSVDAIANDNLGWMIDDVRVTAACGAGNQQIFADGFESGKLSGWSEAVP